MSYLAISAAIGLVAGIPLLLVAALGFALWVIGNEEGCGPD